MQEMQFTSLNKTAPLIGAARLYLAALWVLLIPALHAAELPNDAGEKASSIESIAIDAVTQPFPQQEDESSTEAPPPDGQLDACDWDLEGQRIQEGSREVLRGWSCHSFRWFDSWFGDTEDFREDQVNGLLTVGAEYTQYDGFDPRLRLRVRAPLPNMSKRWDLVLGRVDEDAFISDTQAQDSTFYNPGLVNRQKDDSWLLGLGHRRKGRKSGWDYSLGVRLRLPPRPYAKVQYFYNKSFQEKSDLRFRQTFFWRKDDGFGTTSRGDLAVAIGPQNVLRWEGVATASEATEGTDWYLGQTWYHLFGDRSAFSFLSFIRGETGHPVDLKEYGFNFIWRRPFTRDWLYLSLGPSLTWPRFEVTEHREASLGFGAWIEMEFGGWVY